jgi:hypothetical protein
LREYALIYGRLWEGRKCASQIGPGGRDFRPLEDEIIKADARGRITVGNEVSEKQFRVLMNGEGQILLDPVVVIPEREAWLLNNPQAVMAIHRGVEQSRRGEVHDLGSFASHLDADDDE